MSIFTSEEIKKILKEGKFSNFISIKETEIFEAKRKKPYNFSNKKSIREFIKDITSLANSKGGFIIFGLVTTRAQDSQSDYVETLDLLNKEEFYSESQLLGIVKENIHPKLKIEINWYPSEENAELGLGVIYIPEQDENKKFFIVKALEIDGEEAKEFYGIPIRNDGGTKWLSVGELYSLSKRTPTNLQEFHKSITNQIDRVIEMLIIKESSNIKDNDIISKIEETLNGK